MLQGRIAIVTGGGSGIGAVIARTFAESGAKVAVAGRDVERLAQVARDIGGEAVPADVTDERSVKALFEQVDARFGGLDILVNNAGIAGPVANAADMDIAAWDETMAINVRGAMLCIKYAVPRMRARGGGSIINMSSGVSSIKGLPNRYAYGATKAAVIGLTKAVAADFITKGIRCNAICPGTIVSPSFEDRVKAVSQTTGKPLKQVRENFIARQPMARLGTAEEVAALALFLASDESSYITGQPHLVDGGLAL